ncbi:MAG: hypothetical protein K9N23_06620 [Akkermansiaceae bacterium]|nr:hypothetical protein [Akkermansiaceae bacterium]
MAIRLLLIIIATSSVFCDQVRGEGAALGKQPMIKEAQAFLAMYGNVIFVRSVESEKGKREVVVIKGQPSDVLKSLVKLGNYYLDSLDEDNSQAANNGVVFCNIFLGPGHTRGRVCRLVDDGRLIGTKITLEDLLKASNLEPRPQKNEVNTRAKGRPVKPESAPTKDRPTHDKVSDK